MIDPDQRAIERSKAIIFCIVVGTWIVGIAAIVNSVIE